MTENTMMPIDELIDSVIMQLKEQNYMESILTVYKRTYHRIKEFMLLNDYQNYNPDQNNSMNRYSIITILLFGQFINRI